MQIDGMVSDGRQHVPSAPTVTAAMIANTTSGRTTFANFLYMRPSFQIQVPVLWPATLVRIGPGTKPVRSPDPAAISLVIELLRCSRAYPMVMAGVVIDGVQQAMQRVATAIAARTTNGRRTFLNMRPSF